VNTHYQSNYGQEAPRVCVLLTPCQTNVFSEQRLGINQALRPVRVRQQYVSR
jgi:hypothetical protein